MSHQTNEADFLILLVEDEESDAIALQRALRRHGVSAPVRWVKDGLEALHFLQAEELYVPTPELIILDLRMPRMSGLELLAWLRDRPSLRNIPTIVMSSSSSTQDIQQAYALGAHTYTVKPSDFGSLVRLVKAAYASWVSKAVRQL
jgi:CheY-like chemotaxis protein